MILESVYHTVLAVIYVIYGIFMIPYVAYWTIVTPPSLTAQAAINPMLMMLDWADSSLWVRVGLVPAHGSPSKYVHNKSTGVNIPI